MPEDFIDVKDGDTLEPHHINDAYAELRRWRKLEGDDLVVVGGADSAISTPTITWGGGNLLYLAKVGASNIAARSGATPGSGPVTLQEFDGTSFVAGAVVTALNWSSSAIVAGKYVWLAWFTGAWFIIAVDC